MRFANWGGAICAAALLGACTAGDPYSYYAQSKKRDGLFRTEFAPADAPYTNNDLVRNFESIAFHSEFRRDGERLVQAKTEKHLARWEKPVRYRLEGAGVTGADRSEYAALSRRLSELTGLDIRETAGRGDITVRIFGPAERLEFVRDLRRRGLEGKFRLISRWAASDNFPCVGQIGFAKEEGGEIISALIMVKDELQGDYRRLCIHEEFVQTLGLINDDASVRPSIFNDDQEFALLTEHDEFLLRMLYDPSLTAGMTLADARPLLPEIIGKLRPDG